MYLPNLCITISLSTRKNNLHDTCTQSSWCSVSMFKDMCKLCVYMVVLLTQIDRMTICLCHVSFSSYTTSIPLGLVWQLGLYWLFLPDRINSHRIVLTTLVGHLVQYWTDDRIIYTVFGTEPDKRNSKYYYFSFQKKKVLLLFKLMINGKKKKKFLFS